MPRSGEPIHILHVVPGLMPGGMELAMAKVISGLSNDGMRHSIACLKGEAEIADRLPATTTIYYFHAKPNEPGLPFRLRKLIRELRPDVIHARNWGAWPEMALARFLATWPMIPFIFSFHGLGKAGYMPWRRRVASKIMVHTMTRLFTVSQQSCDMLVKHWGWPKERTEVIPNGVDTSRFYPIPRSHAGNTVVGSVGNLRTVKNHALILRACAKLIKQGAEIEIRIAGEGEQREPLETLAIALGIQNRVNFPGRIEDIPGFLHDLDFFVLSSDSEQHPNALNEAMACGVPSISTRVGCVDDLLAGGKCGIIIEPGDEQALVSALGTLITDKGFCQKIAQAGVEQVRNHYCLEIMLERYKNLYLGAATSAG
jgi:glycosyltransferase involved in cell wall biosynthesis